MAANIKNPTKSGLNIKDNVDVTIEESSNPDWVLIQGLGYDFEDTDSVPLLLCHLRRVGASS